MLEDTTPDVQPCGTSNAASLYKEATMANIVQGGSNFKAEYRPRGNVLERSTTERRCGKPERVGDVDLAEYLAAGKFSGVLHDEGDYYCNTGKHWEVISDQEADQAVARLNGTEYTIKDGDNTKTVRLSLGDGKVAGILNRLRKRLGQPYFFADAAVGINCESGFIVFDAQGTPKLEPHSLWHRQRHVHPATWSEEADNTALAKVVRDKFAVCFKGDKDAEEKLDLIFETAGVAMLGLGGQKNSKAVIFLGETAENGKSTLLDVIEDAMPEGSVSHVAAKDFRDKNEVAQLRGKLLNTAAEVGASIGDEEFKKIITGDPISGRNLYKDTFNFRPPAQHIFATDRMPTFPGGIGHEIRRRLHILTFNHTITKEERDETVETLAKTHPNELLAGIVEGASRYIRQGGFTVPASSVEAMAEWSQTADPVLSWMAERFKMVRDAEAKTKTKTAYSDFKLYCLAELQMREKDIPGPKSFTSRVKAACRSNPELQHIRHTHSGNFRGFVGMELKELTEEMDDLSPAGLRREVHRRA